jgi:hypothetical protein
MSREHAFHMTNANPNRPPLFKSLSDDALRAEYAGYRELAYNNARMAQSMGAGGRGKAARQMGRLMRNLEIIEAIARQRRIRLA